ERGALGLIINKPSPMSMQDLFEKVELQLGRTDLIEIPVLKGGPVHTERGFVLHDPMTGHNSESEPEHGYASTLAVPGGLEMTTSKDVLEALSTGAGPKRVLITLGYAAWAQGQLESELAENSWLTVQADAQVIFDTPIELRYDSALALLGLQAWMLSPQAGHA
ncbi:MAG: DUF179 domain-containing protein, partial [Betaproteobacteria bacterium]|nr:DUF179 domain-containing protein [Betaproteobacteria bacterium]